MLTIYCATITCTAVTAKIYILQVLIPSNTSYICTKRVFVLTCIYCVCVFICIFYEYTCAVREILYLVIRIYPMKNIKYICLSFYTSMIATTARFKYVCFEATNFIKLLLYTSQHVCKDLTVYIGCIDVVIDRKNHLYVMILSILFLSTGLLKMQVGIKKNTTEIL